MNKGKDFIVTTFAYIISIVSIIYMTFICGEMKGKKEIFELLVNQEITRSIESEEINEKNIYFN